MANNGLPGLGYVSLQRPPSGAIEYVIVQRSLKRIFAFTGLSIDDVVNNPIARNIVLGYFKVHRQVERGCEVADLERWWNGR